MNSLAELKRKLTEGTTVTLLYSYHPGHKYLNIPRKIEIRQSNAIMFEGGSWLRFPKAKEILFYGDNPNKFAIRDQLTNKIVFLSYEIQPQGDAMKTITQKQWNETSDDSKGIANGQLYILQFIEEKGTYRIPVIIADKPKLPVSK